jgi:hypothetical protein
MAASRAHRSLGRMASAGFARGGALPAEMAEEADGEGQDRLLAAGAVWSGEAAVGESDGWWPAPAPEPVAPERALPPARRPDRLRAQEAARRLRRGLAVVGACGAVGLALAWGALAVSLQANGVQAMQQRLAAVLATDQRLQAQWAELDSPARIQALAVDRLGLQRPAAYVPVPVVPVVPAPAAGRSASAVVRLPVPPGPLPGSPAALWTHLRAAVSGLWRRIAG